MITPLELVITLVNISAWGTYLFLIKYIRNNSDVKINNYNILNLPRTYSLYIKTRKANELGAGALFCFHIISLVSVIIAVIAYALAG